MRSCILHCCQVLCNEVRHHVMRSCILHAVTHHVLLLDTIQRGQHTYADQVLCNAVRRYMMRSGTHAAVRCCATPSDAT
jgi:hypothetical protein